MELLTAIVPVGPNHLNHNRISTWADSANQFSDLLKIIIVEDRGFDKNELVVGRNSEYKIKNLISVIGHFGSPGGARNAGLGLSKTPWTCFWDSDDQPDIDEFFNLLKKDDVGKFDILIGRFVRVSSKNIVLRTEQKIQESPSSFASDPGIWRMIFKTKVIDGLKFEDFRMAEDQLFLLNLNFPEKNILVEKNLVYNYFVEDPAQLSNNDQALSNIPKVIDKILIDVHSGIIKNSKFLSFVMARLYLSGFKNVALNEKLRLVKRFIFTTYVLGPYTVWFLLECVRVVFKKFKLA